MSTPRTPDVAVPSSSRRTGVASGSAGSSGRALCSVIIVRVRILIRIFILASSSFPFASAFTLSDTFLVRVMVEFTTASLIATAFLQPKVTISFPPTVSVPENDLRSLGKRTTTLSAVQMTLPLSIMGTLFKMMLHMLS